MVGMPRVEIMSRTASMLKRIVRCVYTTPVAAIASVLVLAACDSTQHSDDQDRPEEHAGAMHGNAAPSVAEATLPSATVGALTISNIVAPAPAGDAPMALYFTVTSSSASVDTLVGVVVNDSVADLHESVHDGMRAVSVLTVSAASKLVLSPGGFHAMFDAPSPRVVAGDSLKVVLTFSVAGRVELYVPVVAYSELEQLTPHSH